MGDVTAVVFVIDNDPSMRAALEDLVGSVALGLQPFASPQEFLASRRPDAPGCLVLDVRLPGMSGLTFQKQLARVGVDLPVIFITGHGDIRTSVRAMKAGAIDFLTKPVDGEALLAAIERARGEDAEKRELQDERASITANLAKLTPREREVLTHVIAGRLNKQIASDLGTVEKTIKVHRGRMMSKMGVHSVAELVRIAERAGVAPHNKQ